jgi:hypothetical protein
MVSKALDMSRNITPVISFHQNSWLFFQRGWSTAGTCYVWIENQTARPAETHALLLHLGSW